MRSFRRATQRVATPVVAVASLFVLATCDFDKISGTPKPLEPADIDRIFNIVGDSLIPLGASTTLGVSSEANLENTAQRWTSDNPAVASVDSTTGEVTGVALGTAVITGRLIAPELDTGVTKTHSVRVKYAGLAIEGVADAPADSLTGLNQTRAITVRGTDFGGTSLEIVTATLSGGLSGSDTVFRIEGSTIRARKGGTAALTADYDGLSTSVQVKVRQVAKTVVYLTTVPTEYVADVVSATPNPDANRTIPVRVRDVSDSIIPAPVLRWRSADTNLVTIDSVTGVLRVKSVTATTTITVRSDTVPPRPIALRVEQAVAELEKNQGDDQTAQVAALVTTLPRVTARDAAGTVVAGAPVAFVASGDGVVTGGTATTSASGVAQVGSWRLGTRSGAQSLVAQSGSASAAFSATATPGPAARLAFGVQPSSAPPSTNIAPAIRVAVTDTLNNVVTSGSGTVTLSLATNPGAATLLGTTSATVTNGLATFGAVGLNNAAAGYSLRATAASLTSAVSNQFDIFSAATKVGFITQPSNGVINQAISPEIRVAVQDANGTTVTTANNTVTLTINTGPVGGTISGVTSVTAVNGIATFSGITLSAAGAYALRATPSGSLTAANSSAFTIASVGSAVRLGFATNPTTTVAGSAINSSTGGIRVAVQDANGATVSTVNPQVTLSFEVNAGNGTLSGTLTQTAVSGVATFTGININKSGTGYKLKAEATGATLTAATSNSFDITPGTASKWRFVQQPTATQVGTPLAPAVVVAASDNLDNTVTAATGSVGLGLTGCSGLSGGNSVALANGVATFSALSVANAGNGCVLVASGTFGTLNSQSFSVVASGGAVGIRFLSSPTNTVANASLGSIQVALVNSSGATVTSAVAQITIAIGNNPGSGTLSGTTTATTTNGVATFDAGNAIQKSGAGYTLVANATGYPTATSEAFDILPAAAAKVGFIVQPSNVVAGEAIAPSIGVAIQDNFGNTVTTATSPVQLSINNNPGPGTLRGTLTQTPVNGVATFDNVIVNRVAVGYTLLATAPNTALTTATSASFNVTPGTATTMMFIAQPASGTTAGATMPAVTVQVVDAEGNAATTPNNPITLALTGGNASATLSNAVATPSNGLATFSNLSVSHAGTGYRLNATASGLSTVASNTFDIAVGVPTLLKFIAQPTATTANKPETYQVAIADAAGNTVTTVGPTNLTIAHLSGPGAIGGGPLTVTTNSGVATFSNVTISAPGDFVLQATGGGYTAGNSQTISVAPHQLVPDAGDNQTGTVNTNLATQASVLVTDGAGTPAAGVSVTFTATSDGKANGLTTGSLTSDANGRVAVTWKLRTIAGPDTLFFALTNNPNIKVRYTATANSGPLFGINKVAETDGQTAAINTPVPLPPSVKLVDSFGNGIGGLTVTFAPNSGSGTVTGGTQTSASDGTATVGSWTLGPSAGTHTLVVTSGGSSASFTATATSSDPCSTVTAHTIGATVNGSLTTSDCQVESIATDKFSVTVTPTMSFFQTTMSSSAFLPALASRLWNPTTATLLSTTGASPVVRNYLLADGTYEIHATSNTAGADGAYTFTTALNPSNPTSGCVGTLVNKGINASQTLSTGCTVAHDAATPVSARVTSVRYYIIFQPANTTLTVRMNSTDFDSYLEAHALVAGGATQYVIHDDDGGGFPNSLMTIPSSAQARFVQIRAAHYPEDNDALLSGAFTLIIDP